MLARLNEPYLEARHEAIEGLSKRGDLTVVPVLIRELHEGVASQTARGYPRPGSAGVVCLPGGRRA